MRSIWKGSISFGLVNVPVKVYSATEDHDIKFHQVHAKDNGRIRYKRVCEVCGEVVEYRDIARAYESDDGQTVVITDEDISTLPEERSREIEVLEFVPASDIDPLMYDSSYYLEPDGKSTKSYVLLAKTLMETDRVAIVHFALRNKTRLAALRVKDFSKRDVMVIHTLLWPDEIRDPDFPVLDTKVEIKPAELKMAGQVVESMTDDFAPERYEDTYQEQLKELVEAKLEGGEAFTTEEQAPKELDETEDVSDLLAKLEASVKARRSGGNASGDGKAAKKAPAKKAAAKKAPAKKTAKKTGQESRRQEVTSRQQPYLMCSRSAKLERVSEMRHVDRARLVTVSPGKGREADVILDRFRLDDQVAVVTGAGRGLGAAMALAFAEAGADVVIASRTRSQLEEVAEQIKAVGRRAHIVTADLAHPEETAKLAGAAVEAFGKLDIVVNNVGGTMPNTLLTTSTKDLQRRVHLQRRDRPRADHRGGAADARTLRRRQHHQHHLDDGPAARPRVRRLRHRKSRARPLHPADRTRPVPEDPGQRDRARFDPHLRTRCRRLQRRAARADGEGDPDAPPRRSSRHRRSRGVSRVARGQLPDRQDARGRRRPHLPQPRPAHPGSVRRHVSWPFASR